VEGDTGFVYKGTTPFEVDRVDVKNLSHPKTKIVMNVANPEEAFGLSFIPNNWVDLFASTLARNQAQVMMMTIMVLVPMLLLSGITNPMEAMPKWVLCLMTLSPLRYHIEITRGILFKGVGLKILSDSVLAMLLLGNGTFGIEMARFRWQFE